MRNKKLIKKYVYKDKKILKINVIKIKTRYNFINFIKLIKLILF